MARPSRMQRLLPWVALALLVAVLTGATRAIVRVFDRTQHPWAYGDPTLAGQWVGRVTSGGGTTTQTVYLELERALRETRYGTLLPTTCSGGGLCAAIDGRALTCDATGRVRTLSLTGWPLARDGSRFRVLMVPIDSPAVDGLVVNTLESRWDGADAIAAEAGFTLRRGESAITDSGDPDTGRPARFALHRGTEDEFRRACGS